MFAPNVGTSNITLPTAPNWKRSKRSGKRSSKSDVVFHSPRRWTVGGRSSASPRQPYDKLQFVLRYKLKFVVRRYSRSPTMGIDRSRRITFEESADLYNETRARYPDALIEDIIRLSALRADGYILEIGCGAGNATVSFAKRGYRLLGIELGERLAEYARQNCREYPNAVIVQSEFERYDLPPRSFDLAVSADAFHWIRPEVGYPKAQAALKADGSFAFFWQLSVDPQTDWSRAVDETFQRLAPQYDRPNQPMDAGQIRNIIMENFREHCGIEDVTVKMYDWTETLSAEKYVKLLRTYSGFRGMEAVPRESLDRDVYAVIENAGGSIQQPYQAILFHAKAGRMSAASRVGA
ncbi:MAG: class I SAM-dependent methyltransferase [Chloroflexi bacterium CFX1]|nr:class I SAM-dependent methyltransferase [Chloroflexi bacterium CFX1]MCQ3954559.1 hypothetical protein [Chloroflexota bacterium]MDL1919705.1 class I SAM-dependent methyltransferase [Chloroflexi bacterium CFX5]